MKHKSYKVITGEHMIAHLKGSVERQLADSLILDVHGIGFRIFSSSSTLTQIGSGELILVFTHTYVREDTLALYGFLTEGELRMFELLLSVSGIGPKAAIAVVSALAPSAFSLAVLTEDSDKLTLAQGIGKKSAQRIILELKDKLKKEQGAQGVFLGGATISSDKDVAGLYEEAVSALMMLGYSAVDAQKSVSGVMEEGKSLENVIRDALKQKGK